MNEHANQHTCDMHVQCGGWTCKTGIGGDPSNLTPLYLCRRRRIKLNQTLTYASAHARATEYVVLQGVSTASYADALSQLWLTRLSVRPDVQGSYWSGKTWKSQGI